MAMIKRPKGVSASAFSKRQLEFTSKDFYSPSDLKHVSEREMRKEYTKLRDIAQKRLKRLMKNDPDNIILEYHPTGFKKLGDIDNVAELRKRLADLSRFINTESSTIAGQKKIAVRREKVLLDKGYLTGKEEPEYKKKLMKFVNYIEDVLNENFMYHPHWRNIIRDDKFKDEVMQGNYGQAYEIANVSKIPELDKWSGKDEEVRQAAEQVSEDTLRSILDSYRAVETDTSYQDLFDLLE